MEEGYLPLFIAYGVGIVLVLVATSNWWLITLAVLSAPCYLLYRRARAWLQEWRLRRINNRELQYEQYGHEVARELLLDHYHEAMDTVDEITREEDSS